MATVDIILNMYGIDGDRLALQVVERKFRVAIRKERSRDLSVMDSERPSRCKYRFKHCALMPIIGGIVRMSGPPAEWRDCWRFDRYGRVQMPDSDTYEGKRHLRRVRLIAHLLDKGAVSCVN